jgi:hypothetical protein
MAGIRCYDVGWSDEVQVLVKAYRPQYFYPAPHLILVPGRYPKSVQKEILSSFPLYWMDMGACANKLRIALERLMDEMGVSVGSLHARIKTYGKTVNSQLKGKLEAVKWLGNHGSHTGELKERDLLDAYRIIDDALTDIYPDSAFRTTDQIATEINQNKGAAPLIR